MFEGVIAGQGPDGAGQVAVAPFDFFLELAGGFVEVMRDFAACVGVVHGGHDRERRQLRPADQGEDDGEQAGAKGAEAHVTVSGTRRRWRRARGESGGRVSG